MNPERWKIYRECKPYLFFNDEKCIDEISEDAPDEIKEKWEKFNEMEDDQILIPDEMQKMCRCCGKYTLDIDSIHDVCYICGWKNDPIQEENPDMSGGVNKYSLNFYRAMFKANELLNDKSICILKYVETIDYYLFEYGTKDKKTVFDNCMIKVDKKSFEASYYTITAHLDEINKLKFTDI